MKRLHTLLKKNKWLLKLLHSFDLEILFLYDYLRFKKYYSTESKKNKDIEQLKAWILMDKHKVEKALSLPEVRHNFGLDLIKRLDSNLDKYRGLSSEDDCYKLGVGAIKAYKEFHENSNVKAVVLNEINMSKYEEAMLDTITENVGVRVAPEYNIDDFNFDKFAKSRFSCRNYRQEEVPRSIIDKAVMSAIKTPSVCNRQHWKCHVFSGKKKDSILKLQTGNNGFTDVIPHVAVITSNLKSFYLPSERYQQYIDGGMFAMSFIYALHANGVQSCALNWSAYIMADVKIHEIIPENESVIMVVAFGYAAESALVAKSPRKNINDILCVE